jgi:hypothetical protein
LPPKMTTLEEQQMEIPEFQELTKKKEALAGLKSERQKFLDQNIKQIQDQLQNAEDRQASLRREENSFDAMRADYKKRKQNIEAQKSTTNTASELRFLLSQLQYNPEKQIPELQEKYKKVSEEKAETQAARTDKANRLLSLQQEIKSIRELQTLPQFTKMAEERQGDFFGQDFKSRLEAANKEQAAALAKFEEAKKRVKYRPPAGVPLDERGVPITA